MRARDEVERLLAEKLSPRGPSPAGTDPEPSMDTECRPSGLLWRQRGNGQAFRDSADHYYSVPQVIDVDHRPTTLTPIYAWARPDCDRSQFLVAGDGQLEEPTQHPTLCRSKAQPSSATLAEEVLLSYCVKRLPQGTRYHTN